MTGAPPGGRESSTRCAGRGARRPRWSARAGFIGSRVAAALDAAGLSPDLVESEHRLLAEVLDALAGTEHRPVLVPASSGGTVYTPHVDPPYAETAPTAPSSSYGRAKLRLEREVRDRADSVRPVVARLSNVYGPGQRAASGYGVLAH